MPLRDLTSDELSQVSSSDSSNGSYLDSILGFIGTAGNSALLGKAPYLDAAIETPIQKIMGMTGLVRDQSISDIWSQNLSGAQNAETTLNQNAGVGEIPADLIGGFLSPVNKLGLVQKAYGATGLTGILSRLLTGAGISAVSSNDSADIASNAGIGGGLSLALDTLGLGGKALGAIGGGLLRKASGLTARDYQAAALAEGLSNAGQGADMLKTALSNTMETSGPLDYLKNLVSLGSPTESFLVDTANKAKALQNPIDAQIKGIIDTTSNALGPGQVTDLGLINGVANNLNASGRNNLLNRIEGIGNQFIDSNPQKLLSQLQKEKQGVIFSADPEQQNAMQVWRRSLRSALEKATNAEGSVQLAPGGWEPGTLKDLNKQSGSYQGLIAGLLKDLPAAQASDPVSAARMALQTTGGSSAVGAGFVADHVVPGAGPLASLLALGTYSQPAGRVIGKVLGDSGSNLATGAFSPAIRTAITEGSIQPGNSTPSTSTPKFRDITPEELKSLSDSQKMSLTINKAEAKMSNPDYKPVSAQSFAKLGDQYFYNHFNTKLSPSEEQQYQKWLTKKSQTEGRDISLDQFNYDMRGFWKSNGQQADNGHFPDTFKKPNHETFSDESQYNGKKLRDGTIAQGGHWDGNTFTPSPLQRRVDKIRGSNMTNSDYTTASMQMDIQPAKEPKANDLVKAIINTESSGKSNVTSSKGAQGLMQLMPATGKEWHAKLGITAPYDPYNAQQNKQIGTAYINWLLKQFGGDKELALTAYQTGIGTVKKLLKKYDATTLQEILPHLGPEGRAYAGKVLGQLNLTEA